MSVKTRIAALEKLLAKGDPLETVIVVNQVVVRTREEVEQLRAAGVMDPRRDNGRPLPRGPVRLVIRNVDMDMDDM